MTLPQNVKDALALIETLANDEGDYAEPRAVETIRAHLMSQEAEIGRLNAEWHEMFDRALLAESRLAAANTLLRQVDVTVRQGYDMRGVLQDIQSHLQGAGDEA